MPKIFISYRREESKAEAGRIYDRLRSRFGRTAVFMDDDIPLGGDFPRYIKENLNQCLVMIAVIGPDWAGVSGAVRRIDHSRDFVRIEIEEALARGLTLLPVLINGATMPDVSELPPSIAGLADRNAIVLNQGPDFNDQIGRLVKAIRAVLKEAGQANAAEGPESLSPDRDRPSQVSVLLCLLTDQHLPNLLSVHHYRPDRLVLVESEEMRRRDVARHFLSALRLGGLDYDGQCEIAPIDTVDSMRTVRRTLMGVYAKHPGARWIANITGGTKTMSSATYKFFKENAALVVYTSAARPAELIDFDTENKNTCGYRPSIAELLAGSGFEGPRRPDMLAGAEERARGWWEIACAIAIQDHTYNLLPLPDHDRARARERGFTLAPGQLRIVDEPLLRQIAASFSLDPNDGSGELSRFAAQFLTGGWLEVFWWGLVSKHAEALGCWDVRLGLGVGRVGNPSIIDLDVAFVHDYRICTIECVHAQGRTSQIDVLYKVAAIAHQLRALRVQSYLATTSSSILDDRSLRTIIRERAELYNCRILTDDTIRSLAQRPDDLDLIQTSLFGPKAVTA
jgi:hypothetical protein